MASVLVVDDDAGTREALGAVIDMLGHQCVSAANGQHALRQAQLSPPDLLITDLHMPLMDGFELLQAIRNDPVLAAIPALIYSGTVDAEAERRAVTCGVRQVFSKPGNPRLLVQAIREALAGGA